MFNDALFSNKMKRVKRLTWLTLPFSLLLHALLIAGLVVVPLLRADANLPKAKVITVSITAPPTPLPPSRGTGKKNNGAGKVAGGKKTDPGTTHMNPPMPSGKLQVPFKVPETIEEEAIKNVVGNGPVGDDNGIPEGVEEGGDPNALFGPEKGEKVDGTQPALRIASVQMPRKIREIKPVYSSVAIAARVQGVVIIEAMTDIYGRVHSARIISSASPLLNEEALKAVKQWLYEPYILNGIPKPVVFTVTITFTLSQ